MSLRPAPDALRLEFGLEDDLPPDGEVFAEPVALDDEDETGRTSGHWRSAGRLAFRPDGGVAGKFLDLRCDPDPANPGEGHRSGWAASYQVFPGSGVLRIYDCRDLPPDQADLSDLPLASEEVHGCSLRRRYIGSGGEAARLAAARDITRTRYYSNVFERGDRLSALAGLPTRPVCKRVLTTRHACDGGVCRVTCTGLSGDVAYALAMPEDTPLADLRARVLDRTGPVVLVTPHGQVLKRSRDSLPLKAAFGQRAEKAPRMADSQAATQISPGRASSGAQPLA